jgi:hypothetical protein
MSPGMSTRWPLRRLTGSSQDKAYKVIDSINTAVAKRHLVTTLRALAHAGAKRPRNKPSYFHTVQIYRHIYANKSILSAVVTCGQGAARKFPGKLDSI